MKKKFSYLALVLFYLAVLSLSIPFVKQLAYIHTMSKTRYTEVSSLKQVGSVPLEAVQPLDLQEVIRASAPSKPAIGYLEIDQVELSLPIFPGISQTNMTYGAAAPYVDRNPTKNNVVLLGHHLGYQQLLFGKLLNVKVGSTIKMYYLGQLYQYQVIVKKNIAETEVQYLKANPARTLTLITCDTPSLTDRRIVVQAKLEQQVTNAQQISIERVKHEKLMQKNQTANQKYFVIVLTSILIILVLGTWLFHKFIF